jgi:hypothetical protein
MQIIAMQNPPVSTAIRHAAEQFIGQASAQ